MNGEKRPLFASPYQATGYPVDKRDSKLYCIYGTYLTIKLLLINKPVDHTYKYVYIYIYIYPKQKQPGCKKRARPSKVESKLNNKN